MARGNPESHPSFRAVISRVESGQEVVDAYGEFTRSQFNLARHSEGVPVFIPAKNESTDLPSTLLSIAAQSERGESSYAVVVDNGSEDKTAEFARKMGLLLLMFRMVARWLLRKQPLIMPKIKT